MVDGIGCLRSWSISSAVKWPSSSRPAAFRECWRPKLRLQRFRSCSPAVAIRSRRDSFTASIAPEAILPGVTSSHVEAASKQLGLLREILPKAVVIGVLVDPNDAITADREAHDMREAARSDNELRFCKRAARTTSRRSLPS